MKTTYAKATDAYTTLLRTARQPVMDLATAGRLFRLRKSLFPAYEFWAEMQQQIIDELGATTDSAGRILFKSPEEEAAYKEKIAELNRQECELDVVPVQIPEDANLKYTPEDLWILDGFVEIVAKETEKKDKE